MSNNPDAETVKSLATGFLAMFVIDDFGQLDIRWDKDPRYACMYSLLFSVTDPMTSPSDTIEQKTVTFKPDNLRILLLMFVLLGITTDNISWEVNGVGKLVVTKMSLPDSITFKNGTLRINRVDDEFVETQATTNDGLFAYLTETFYAENATTKGNAVRQFLSVHYKHSVMNEVTHLYNLLNNTLWRLAHE